MNLRRKGWTEMAKGSSLNLWRWALGSALVLALLVIAWDPGTDSGWADSAAGKWQELTLLYNSDVHGKIEPCG